MPKRRMTAEQRAEVSRRMKRYHAAKRRATANGHTASADLVTQMARRGAERRLEELDTEQHLIYDAFPDLVPVEQD